MITKLDLCFNVKVILFENDRQKNPKSIKFIEKISLSFSTDLQISHNEKKYSTCHEIKIIMITFTIHSKFYICMSTTFCDMRNENFNLKITK
jgi:hypothetical protein